MTTWIFLRGLARESRHWGAFPELFRRALPDAQVHTPDLPGNGLLNARKSPCQVGEAVESLRAQLTRQGISPPYYVLAMSLGAMVAVEWAARYPREIRAGVLINTSLRPFSPFYRRLKAHSYPCLLKLALLGANDQGWEKTILELTSNASEDRAELLTNWIAYRRDQPVSLCNALRQLLAAARYTAPLTRPAPPMLILSSKEDALVDSSCSSQLAERWGAAIARHPTAGHDLPLDDGAWVAGQVSQWLQSVTESR